MTAQQPEPPAQGQQTSEHHNDQDGEPPPFHGYTQECRTTSCSRRGRHDSFPSLKSSKPAPLLNGVVRRACPVTHLGRSPDPAPCYLVRLRLGEPGVALQTKALPQSLEGPAASLLSHPAP